MPRLPLVSLWELRTGLELGSDPGIVIAPCPPNLAGLRVWEEIVSGGMVDETTS